MELEWKGGREPNKRCNERKRSIRLECEQWKEKIQDRREVESDRRADVKKII